MIKEYDNVIENIKKLFHVTIKVNENSNDSQLNLTKINIIKIKERYLLGYTEEKYNYFFNILNDYLVIKGNEEKNEDENEDEKEDNSDEKSECKSNLINENNDEYSIFFDRSLINENNDKYSTSFDSNLINDNNDKYSIFFGENEDDSTNDLELITDTLSKIFDNVPK